MDFSSWFDTIFKINIAFFLKIFIYLAAFHLGLHCLQKYLFRGFPIAMGKGAWVKGRKARRKVEVSKL